ncbi:xylose ABC transporter ATP-binding protein [Clostridia bacterium]|nr:xylose ABC transporter ATP-binding protein [Clostridia bacterium]
MSDHEASGSKGLILEMVNITKEFSGIPALDDVSLSVRKGEIHAICGENGAGKSTLMKVLSGVYPSGSFDGEIRYHGELCHFRDIRDSERRGIVIIHQELALSPYMSIAENIFLGNEMKNAMGMINWNRTHSEAAKVLERVGFEGESVDTPVSEIGVGKQQLVEIAKALVKKVELLILDEPTAALNDEDSRHLMDIIRSLKENGITCILISHKLNEVNQIADAVTILRDGRVIETLRKDEDSITETRIIRGMVGRELTNRYPPREHNIGEVRFDVAHWNVYHPNDKSRQVIRDVSFNARRGEVVGFAGLMGSGRTELAMSLFGGAWGANISGDIKMDGKPVRFKSVRDAIDSKLAYVSEDRKQFGLVLDNDIKWNTSLAALRSRFSRMNVINKSEEILAAEEYRGRLNIKCSSIEQTCGALSGGNQQKVVLSRWMLSEPDVLILDEPTRGIDVGAKYEIYTIINELAGMGKSVIFISSEMPELLGMCDRVYVLSKGEIAGELPRAELTQEAIMRCIMNHFGREKRRDGTGVA